jgi:distribution and morphology protein 10
LSVGGEVYFSPVNKSGGLSTGLRFTTLPVHTGFPYTMTLTVNPLMGSLNGSYAVKAGRNIALCSRFDFNVYSYESDVSVGVELWKRDLDTAWARRMVRPEWLTKAAAAADNNGFISSDFVETQDDAQGVLKARLGIDGKATILWETRVKELLVGIGAGFNLKKKDQVLGNVGLEISYSS